MGFFTENRDKADPTKMQWSRSGVYLLQGTYLVTITAIKMIKGRTEYAFVVEFIIDESDQPERPAGMSASQYIGFGKVPEAAYRDCYLFVAALMGHANDKEWISNNLSPEVLDMITHPSNPIGPYKVKMPLVVVTRDTKTGGKFSVHEWGNAINPPQL
jgi:hypothetical protein